MAIVETPADCNGFAQAFNVNADTLDRVSEYYPLAQAPAFGAPENAPRMSAAEYGKLYRERKAC